MQQLQLVKILTVSYTHLDVYKRQIAGWSDDGADVTNAVKSYPPNDFGLYDMAGNAVSYTHLDVYKRQL